MTYPALPDRRIPYHRDGSVVGHGEQLLTNSVDAAIAQGISGYLSSADLIELNDGDYGALAADLTFGHSSANNVMRVVWWFWPETREVAAVAFGHDEVGRSAVMGTIGGTDVPSMARLEGSTDTTNGVDGTWETASLPGGSGVGFTAPSLAQWRSSIATVSFTGPKRVLRAVFTDGGGLGSSTHRLRLAHWYGEKASGQTPDDLLFIDDVTDLEFSAALDFGDRPLGTTVTRVWRLKNASATKTANTINIQCNDTDFAISTDGVNWVSTINIASLAPGAESSDMYVRCTTPNPGATLGPRFAEIVVTVGSWT